MKDSTVVSHTLRSPQSDGSDWSNIVDVRSEGRGQLEGSIRLVNSLTDSERSQMFALFTEYFLNVSRYSFEQDLSEKEWAFVGTDSISGEVRGFSTLMRLDAVVDGRPVAALFSGDTIIGSEHWGQLVFPEVMGRHVLRIAKSIGESIKGASVFWLLISSGYRTYRFLPLFFRNFYPKFDQPALPGLIRTMDAFALLKFGAEYDLDSRTIRLTRPTPLKPGVGEIDERRLRNPHVAFFAASNPGYARGDNLVCIAELSDSNLTRAGRRILGGSGP